MVWYQKFEYAVGHWLQKATEHMLGCVLCSPGCFSLFRGSALMDDNVMKTYTTPPTEPRHYVQYDQGEDRWLCTLLLQQGYRVEYCAASDSFTYAPEGFNEFWNQRRRWTPSTMANILDLLEDWKSTTTNNQDISFLYIGYQIFMFCSGIITPGTIFLLVLGAIKAAVPDLPLWVSMLINLLPLIIFVFLCFKASSNTQLAYAGIWSIIYTMIMTLVFVGIIRQAATYGFCSVSTIFLVTVITIFIITAILHPLEFTCLLHGLLYFMLIPSMSMMLMIYSLANLHVVSWGTREAKPAAAPAQQVQSQTNEPKKPTGVFGELLSKLTGSTSTESKYTLSLGSMFRCLCCPSEKIKTEDLKFKAILERLNDLDKSRSNVEQQVIQSNSVEPSKSAVPTVVIHGPPTNENTPKLTKKKDPVLWIDDDDLGKGNQEEIDSDETEFWNALIGQYLYPMEKDEKHQKEISDGLLELRNKVCLAFLVINSLFIILVYTLQSISEETTNLSIEIPCGDDNFKGEKIEPISVTFTVVFGFLLVLQFLAMLFHRYSTLLHIVAITEISQSLASQVRNKFGFKSSDTGPTVKEAINLAKELQKVDTVSISSLAPEDPEADYDDDDVDDDEDNGDSAFAEGKDFWGRLDARTRRGSKVHRQPQGQMSLSQNFIRRYQKLATQIRHDSHSESNLDQMTEEMTRRFQGMNKKNLNTVVKMTRNSQAKDHIVKRSSEVRSKWKQLTQAVTKPSFANVVIEAVKKQKEDKDNEAPSKWKAGTKIATGNKFAQLVLEAARKQKEEREREAFRSSKRSSSRRDGNGSVAIRESNARNRKVSYSRNNSNTQDMSDGEMSFLDRVVSLGDNYQENNLSNSKGSRHDRD